MATDQQVYDDITYQETPPHISSNSNWMQHACTTLGQRKTVDSCSECNLTTVVIEYAVAWSSPPHAHLKHAPSHLLCMNLFLLRCLAAHPHVHNASTTSVLKRNLQYVANTRGGGGRGGGGGNEATEAAKQTQQ